MNKKFIFMLSRNWILIFICIILFIGCETERERNKKLEEKYNKLCREINSLEKTLEQLKEEQKKTWRSTAKERFAFLYNIKEYNGKELKYEDYIRKVEIQKTKSPLKYIINVYIYSFVTFKPHFLIFLYNRKGLIIGYCYQKRPLIGGKIKKDKWVKKSYKVKLYEEDQPIYFRIERFAR